jgi:hypothetical protein
VAEPDDLNKDPEPSSTLPAPGGAANLALAMAMPMAMVLTAAARQARPLGRAKEVSQSGGVCRGVRGCFAFLPFSNTKITTEIPDVFLYIDSLRKCYIAHCYLPSP